MENNFRISLSMGRMCYVLCSGNSAQSRELGDLWAEIQSILIQVEMNVRAIDGVIWKCERRCKESTVIFPRENWVVFGECHRLPGYTPFPSALLAKTWKVPIIALNFPFN